ncbi:tetratricopeptide repeat-containing sensor histidine kinase [Mangrovimonas aestuarii]|uniref:tetratricopeptide repeat-containing sensor histidine kinase n=1 Tax=Mangrovimonas aestuarii TaxID=3018443 RepID=UPI002377DBE6|nr:tetratricopeptide repeat-containing sensor histidine kinase [Mangrovimonas aestuarii]
MNRVITLLVFIFALNTFSQNRETDSLSIALAFQSQDSSKVKTSLKLIESLYSKSDYTTALRYLLETEKLSEEIDYPKGLASTTYYKALIYSAKDDYINAVDNFAKCKMIFAQLNDTLEVARVNNRIGLLEIKRGNFNTGLQYVLSAINELERRGLNNELQTAYCSLAATYEDMNLINEAIEYNHKALNLVQLSFNEKQLVKSNANLGRLYALKDDHRKAIEYYRAALLTSSNSSDSIRGEILPLLGGEYTKLENFSLAKEYLDEAYKFNTTTNFIPGLLITQNNLGELNLKQGNLDIARVQLLQAFNIAKALDDKVQLLNNYKLLMELDSSTSNYKNALYWQRQYFSLKDSLATNTKEMANLSVHNSEVPFDPGYTPPIREEAPSVIADITKVNRLKLITYILLGAFVVLATFFILIYSKRRSRMQYTKELEEKNERIETQNKSITEQATNLENINKVKDKLFSIISHDLKDSLSSINGFIDLLKEGSLSRQEFDGLIPELSDNANNASLLLFNLLNWSKSQMQSLEANPSLFDIKEVVEEKIKLFEQKAERKGVSIENQTLRDFIYADRSMVEIIVQNLLANAIKFTRPGDHIIINNHISNGNSILSIADTGIGIPKENIKKLFHNKSFTTTGTKNEKGTGLGLSICKELVDLNHGKIWVESAEKKGSTFFVELPKSNTFEAVEA